MVKEIEVDGVIFVPEAQNIDRDVDGWRLCVVRTYSAGVWYGWVEYDADFTFLGVIVKNARRIWKWQGAFSLSELATLGASGDSRIAVPVAEVKLNRVIELIPMSIQARKALDEIESYGV